MEWTNPAAGIRNESHPRAVGDGRAGRRAAAGRASAGRATRAALLYETHCIACHDNHAHWRNGRLASDWPSLAAQVRRWQDNAGLQWTSDDIDEVARYLNATIYRFPEPSVKQIG